MHRSLFLFTCLTLLFSCKKETSTTNLHYDYFGMEKGRYVIYDAKEITHLSNQSKDTVHYQLKTVIGDTVHDNSGRVGYKYRRYKRATPADEWNLADVWFIIIADHRGELVEENERIVKLVFAPTADKEWDGNAYNTNGELIYGYENLHVPMTINNIQLDSTIKVVQEDVFNLIQWRKKHEIYAKNIGLVRKHYQHLNISNFDVTNVSTGKEFFLEMNQYGYE